MTNKQCLFDDYVTKPCRMYILWEHRVKCSNVWSNKLEDPESVCSTFQPTIKTMFVVGNAGSSKGAAMAAGDEPADWTMAQGPDERQTEVNRKSVAVGKAYYRIQREKAELIRQMQALTLRESTLEAQATSAPELYAPAG